MISEPPVTGQITMVRTAALEAVAEAARKYADWIEGAGYPIFEAMAVRKALAALAAAEPGGWQPIEQDRLISELAMLVRRLIRRAREYEENDAVAAQAQDFLRRKGLTGSPLRCPSPPSASDHAQPEPSEGEK